MYERSIGLIADAIIGIGASLLENYIFTEQLQN